MHLPLTTGRIAIEGAFQDIDDRGARDLADAELFQFTKNAGVAPGVFLGQPNHQRADVFVVDYCRSQRGLANSSEAEDGHSSILPGKNPFDC